MTDVEAAILKDGERLSAEAKARIIRQWLADEAVREALSNSGFAPVVAPALYILAQEARGDG